MDEEPSEDRTSTKDIKLLRYGEGTIQGFANGFESLPTFFFKFIKGINLNVYSNSELHADFNNDEKKMTPVLFSHGLVMNRTNHSNQARELASNGCIVFSIDHTDGTCSYTANGKYQHF